MRKLLVILVFLTLLFSKGSLNAQDQKVVDSLKNELSKVTEPNHKMHILMQISMQYDYGDPKLALKYASEALKVAQEYSDYQGQSQSLLRMAKVYYVLSDLKNGMDCAVKSKEIAESHDYKTEEALANDAIGMMFYEIGDESKSSDCFFSSLKVYEEMKDKRGIGQSLCRIGTLYYNQKDNLKAKDYYIKSAKIAKELNDPEGISSNLHNLGMVYTSEKNYSLALLNYKEALKINHENGNLQLEGSNYLNIGNLYLKMEDFSQANENTERALGIFIKVGNQVRVTKAQVQKGEIFLAMKRYNDVIPPAQSALDTALNHGFKEVIAKAAELLQKAYLAKKDTTRAYKFTMLANQWNDSLALGEKQKNLARLDLQYNFEKREQELRIEKQQRNFFIIFLTVCVVFSVIVIFLLATRYKLKVKEAKLEKENLEKDLDYKKKELTLNVMSLMKKNEMLSDITKKILTIEKESPQEETRKALKKVAKELQKSTDEEILKEFSMRFKEVHGEFYDKLLKNYPTLTPSELKLCAFLRLNMTSKEIAELTGQQIATLENARYRLRQKLGITSSDVNLVTFLAQI